MTEHVTKMWIRVHSRRLLFAAMLFTAACAGGPEWERGSVTELRFGQGGLPTQYVTVADAATLEIILAGFRAAERIEDGPESFKGWHHIDIVGRGVGGRWLYDPETGRFSRLAHNRQPVFRLKESGRLRLNQFFPEASSPLSNTNLSR